MSLSGREFESAMRISPVLVSQNRRHVPQRKVNFAAYA
jgi:hypothetical protein